MLEAYSLAGSHGAVSRLFRALPRVRLHKGGSALTGPQHAVSVPIRLEEEDSGKSARYVAAGWGDSDVKPDVAITNFAKPAMSPRSPPSDPGGKPDLPAPDQRRYIDHNTALCADCCIDATFW